MNENVDELLERMQTDLRTHLGNEGRENVLMIGIHTGGAWVAERLHDALGLTDPLGLLDISFYRDDFSQLGLNPRVRPSKLPLSVEGRHIVLVDDVLYTGRTIRAALNEIFDYGRPASVLLVTLIDREGRELPIQPEIVGRKLHLGPHQQIKLSGPDPLALAVVDVDDNDASTG
ncbi:MAG: bifunctional pyr operon transcriptional regulator/uracil phosphoribosyltransferase PyrR [Pseudomonadota bacterium]|nr:bifunctional pyr operon transcriptional regulator/uracil phosphoribosyltransferase PyrR [Pseudomonadota bacterium]